MLLPERLHILQKAFDKAKCSGLHGHIKPPPISFASELVGLITRKDISTSKHTKKISKALSPGYFRPTSPPPFKSGPWSLKKKWHSPSTMTPNFPTTGLSTQGTKCLGQTPMPSPPDFLGSPSAIPFTKKNTMLLATRHAPSTLLLSAQRKQSHSCSSLPGIKIWPQIPMHLSAANTHAFVNSWAPSHQTNSNMQKCPSKTKYKHHFPNTPGNCRSLPYGTPRAGSASMLTTKTG